MLSSPLNVKRHPRCRSGPLPCWPRSGPPSRSLRSSLSDEHSNSHDDQEEHHDTENIGSQDGFVPLSPRRERGQGEVEASESPDKGTCSGHKPDPEPPDVPEQDLPGGEPGQVPAQCGHLLQSPAVTSGLASLQRDHRVQAVICEGNWIKLYNIAATDTHCHDPGSTDGRAD